MVGLEKNKDWRPVWFLGEPRDNTNNKIEILSYANSVASTPPITVEPKTVISDTGESLNHINPINPHEQTTDNNPPIMVGLSN